MKRTVPMLRNFEEILERAREKGPGRLAVPSPRSRRVFQFLEEAEKAGLIIPVIVGESAAAGEAIDEAIALAANGEVDILFQGDAGLKDFLDALAAGDTGAAPREALSYISLFELPSENRLIMLTDTLVQSFPDIRQKVRIVENAIEFAGSLGIDMPKIAALSVSEMVNFSVPSSLEAAVLARMSERGQLKALIDGPIDIDCSSSRERALRKGLKSPVAGEVDIYFIPNIEAAYAIAEVLVFLAGRTPAGALLGTEFPVVLNPSFEPARSLLLDTALASIRA
jgi:phosphate butyryltransferase